MIDFEAEFQLFQEALDIQDPWYIEYYEFSKREKCLHLYLEFKPKSAFTCPHCHQSACRVYDTPQFDRTWRHLNFWEYETYLHVRLPRVTCDHCGKIRTINVEWSRSYSGFTWKFKADVMQLMKEMPVSAVARKVNEHDTRLWRIFRYY